MPTSPGEGGGPDGLVVVDKPVGPTSHDVVARVRRLAGTRKVGHAGTLDPAASGVLTREVIPDFQRQCAPCTPTLALRIDYCPCGSALWI